MWRFRLCPWFSASVRSGAPGAEDAAGPALLEKAKVFHYVAPEEEDDYEASPNRSHIGRI